MTTLQLIIKKAKALKKAAPRKYSKWTDYVKAASATIKPKKKESISGVKKKTATKKVVKKAAPKKAAKKSTSYHKDTKSHNVRINVVSGVKSILNFSLYVKGKRLLITKSATTAVSEAKFYSSSLNSPVTIKYSGTVVGKYEKGKLVK